MRYDISNEGKDKRWKKGQSGNPNGRPPLLPELDKLLAEILNEGEQGNSVAKRILQALANKALKGDIRAIEVLLNRAYGKQCERKDIPEFVEQPFFPTIVVRSKTEKELVVNTQRKNE